MRIADLPSGERPREKAIKRGISSLSDAELIALILGNGVKGKNVLELSNELLSSYGSLASLGETPYASLLEHKGISSTKALLLLASFEMGKRAAMGEATGRYNPKEIYARYKELMRGERREHCHLLIYWKRGKLKKEEEIASGDTDSLTVGEMPIIRRVLEEKGEEFVIIHNHPSGTALPSQEDIAFTLSLAGKASSLGLRMLDHLIVGDNDYYSFSERRQ